MFTEIVQHTLGYIVSTVISVTKFIQFQSPKLSADFQPIEDEFKSFLNKQNELTKALHSTLNILDVDLTVPLEENALRERIGFNNENSS